MSIDQENHAHPIDLYFFNQPLEQLPAVQTWATRENVVAANQYAVDVCQKI